MVARYILPVWLALAPLGSAHAADLKDPPANGFIVTKSDTVSIPETTALYVGVTGDIQVTMAANGAVVILKAVPVGLYQIRVTQIWSTNTTATNIIAMW